MQDEVRSLCGMHATDDFQSHLVNFQGFFCLACSMVHHLRCSVYEDKGERHFWMLRRKDWAEQRVRLETNLGSGAERSGYFMRRVKLGGRADFLICSSLGIRDIHSLIAGSRLHGRCATCAAVARSSGIMLDIAESTDPGYSDYTTRCDHDGSRRSLHNLRHAVANRHEREGTGLHNNVRVRSTYRGSLGAEYGQVMLEHTHLQNIDRSRRRQFVPVCSTIHRALSISP